MLFVKSNHFLCNDVASTSKPNCWAVLPVGNQVSVTVAIHDRLFVLDPYEAVLQVFHSM